MFESVKTRKQAIVAEQIAMHLCDARKSARLDCNYDNCSKCPAFYGEANQCFAFELAERAHPIRGFIERHFRNNPKAHKKGGK